MKNKTISVIGGDSRQLFCSEHLRHLGYDVTVYGCELGKINKEVVTATDLKTAFKSEYIILPLPVSKSSGFLNTPLSEKNIELKHVIENTTEKNTVFFGMGSKVFTKMIEAKAGKIYDYFESDELILKNAFLTAESLLGIILDKTKISVNGMRVAVTGYGRIGSILCHMLNALGADVSVFLRNSLQYTKANLDNTKAFYYDKLAEKINTFDCIVNTVPARIFSDDILKEINDECVIIECASAPYGFDFERCETLGVSVIKGFSLPGKKRPKTAGIIIAETVDSIIKGEM